MNQPSLFDSLPHQARSKAPRSDDRWSAGGRVAPHCAIEAQARLPGDSPPRARRSDPPSSHAAADRLERSRAAEIQMRRVLDAITARPGRTTREIAADEGLDRHMVGRRTPDLERAGRVVATYRQGDELRWWPADYELPACAGATRTKRE